MGVGLPRLHELVDMLGLNVRLVRVKVRLRLRLRARARVRC